MKRGQRDWLNRGIAAFLVAGALGLITWQGVLYLKEDTETKQPMRIQAIQTTGVSETTLPETETVQVTSTIVTTATKSATASSAASTQKKSTQTQAKAATVETTAAEETAPEVTFPLELNAASVLELQALPGIGEVLAERIVSYREQLGGFQNREQLLEVDGIGESTLAEIYDLLYLTVETYDSEAEPEPIEEPAPTEESAAESPQAQEPQSSVTEAIQTEPEPDITTEPVVEAPEFPLDLNTAEKEELLFLPDMTEELAEEILTFREENLYYSSVYELLYLEHMTSDYFMQIREYVEVQSENP